MEVSTETEERLAAEAMAAARRAEQLAAIRAEEQRKAAEAVAAQERQAADAARQAAQLEAARKVGKYKCYSSMVSSSVIGLLPGLCLPRSNYGDQPA